MTSENGDPNDEIPNEKQISTVIPGEVWAAAEPYLEYGGIKETVETAFRQVADHRGRSEATPLDGEIARLEQENKELRREIRRFVDDKEELIEENEQRIERLRNKRSEIVTEEDRLEAALQQAEIPIRRGEAGRVFDDHRIVKDLAAQHNYSRKEIYTRLKERNPDVPAFVWETMTPHARNRTFSGLSEENVHTPVEARESRGDDEI